MTFRERVHAFLEGACFRACGGAFLDAKSGGSPERLPWSNRGQMTVELCVVLPVAIAVAVIVVNASTFFGCCAEFDRVARNAVRVVAAAPSSEVDRSSAARDVESRVRQVMDDSNLECSVEVECDHRGFEVYEATLAFRPTLFGMGFRGSVFGVRLPALKHVSVMTVDPYRPGKLL